MRRFSRLIALVAAVAALVLSVPAGAQHVLPIGQDCSLSEDGKLKTCSTRYHSGLTGFAKPCNLAASPNVEGACFTLDGTERMPGNLRIEDVTGKPVAGQYWFLKWEPGVGWIHISQGTFCDGKNVEFWGWWAYPTHLEVALGTTAGSVPWGCAGDITWGRNFTGGTLGTITVTFTMP